MKKLLSANIRMTWRMSSSGMLHCVVPTWIWTRYFALKLLLTQDLHSATSQKTTFFFIVPAVKTSNITLGWLVSDKFKRIRKETGEHVLIFIKRPSKIYYLAMNSNSSVEIRISDLQITKQVVTFRIARMEVSNVFLNIHSVLYFLNPSEIRHSSFH
jgi:hypothetical protein